MNKSLLITAVLMLALGVAGGYWLAGVDQQQHDRIRQCHRQRLKTRCFIATR